MTDRYRIVRTPAGACWYVVGKKGLLRSGLPERSIKAARARVRAEFPAATEDAALLPELASSFERYFAGEEVDFDVKLDERRLTPFRKEVYRALKKVRRGRFVTYGELARKIGKPSSARGVGTAMAGNPFPPIVPCHRVVGSDGALRGFSAPGGLDLKRKMLEIEGALEHGEKIGSRGN